MACLRPSLIGEYRLQPFSQGSNPVPPNTSILPLLKCRFDDAREVARPQVVHNRSYPPPPTLTTVLKTPQDHETFKSGTKGLTREILSGFYEEVSYNKYFIIKTDNRTKITDLYIFPQPPQDFESDERSRVLHGPHDVFKRKPSGKIK